MQSQPQGQIAPSQAKYKDDYDTYVDKATILIHSPQTRELFLKSLGITKDPVQTVADLTVQIMRRVDSAAREHGIEVQDGVKAVAAHTIVDLVCELADAARLFTLKPILLKLTLSVVVQQYMQQEIKAGRIKNPKMLLAAMYNDMRNLDPKQRKAAQVMLKELPTVAKKYNHGKGMDTSWKSSKATPGV
jgi:hypothetical protein